MKPSLDSWGCDWKEVQRLWALLLPSERDEVQKRINNLGIAAIPFHKRLETLIVEYRREHGKIYN